MQTVMVGNSVEFECHAVGDPEPTVRWSKVGGPLPSHIMVKGSMLRIDQATEADAGHYPVFSAFSFSKLEEELPPKCFQEANVLTVPQVTHKDSGTYICTASNEHGNVAAFTKLEVHERVMPYFAQEPLSYLTLPTIKNAYKAFNIKVNFRPDNVDGMILYNGQRRTTGADFISLGLVSGRLEFRFDVGSGMATIRDPNPIKLGEFHTVELHRNLTQGFITVDGGEPISGKSQGKFQGLDLNEELHVGGYPNYTLIAKTAGIKTGFVGKTSCCELVTTPLFDGYESYIAYPPLTNVHDDLRVELEFKPLERNGLMFFCGGKKTKVEDFVAVSMVEGHVEFRYELGTGQAVLLSPQPVSLGQWHTVIAERNKAAGHLRVDQGPVQRRMSPGKAQGLNIHTPMYLGGVPSMDILPKPANITQMFDGCIGEVSINNKKVDLSYSFTESKSISRCVDNNPCDRRPCLNSGECMSSGEYELLLALNSMLGGITLNGYTCLSSALSWLYPAYTGQVFTSPEAQRTSETSEANGTVSQCSVCLKRPRLTGPRLRFEGPSVQTMPELNCLFS
ncbi:hypothetical protein GOODEAATRI_011686 [Goodea atripinnis]|uniref:Ig-like domain-containing protein n=1 Tax=Goodea atripinnis TaxID=208336 RepID=A0ABV0MH12_9TELE